MVGVRVLINSLEDAAKGIPMIEGLSKENVEMSTELTVCILEGGMESGKTSIMFVLKMDDGTFKTVECSGAHFKMLNAAVLGSMERFKDNG